MDSPNNELNSPSLLNQLAETVNPPQIEHENNTNENNDSLEFYQNYSLKLKEQFNLDLKNDDEIIRLNLDIVKKNQTISELTIKLKNKDKFIQNINKRLEDHHKRINNLAIHQNSLVDHSSACDEKRISLQDDITRNRDVTTKNFYNLSKINKKFKNALDAIKAQKAEAIKELNILKEENYQTTSTLNLKIKELAEDHENTTTHLRAEFDKKNGTLENENQKLIEEKKNLTDNLTELNKELQESRNKISELTKEINEFSEANETLQISLKNLTNNLIDSNNSVENLKETCKHLDNRNKSLETENEKFRNDIEKLSKDVEQYQKNLEQEMDSRTKLISTYEAKITEYKIIEDKYIKASQPITDVNYFSDSDESCQISLKMGELFNPQYFKQSNTKKRSFPPDGDKCVNESTQSKLPKKIRVMSSDGNDITSHSTFSVKK